MADRAKVTENVQFGVESVEGTAVAAPNNIRSVSVDTKIGGAAEFFRPDGRKFNTLSSLNQEWSTFALNGKGTYTEINYLLAMLFGNVAPASSGLAVKTRAFEMLDTTILTPASMTIEKGSSVRAQQIAGAILTDTVMSFSRKAGITITGNGIGHLFTDGVTLTASPVDIPLVPLVGKQLDVYIDATAAALGTTKLLRAFSLDNTLTGAFGPVWPINSANASYDGHVDLAPTTGTKFMVEADATGMGYLTQYRADTLMFIRIQATGPNIPGETSVPYLFKYDTCVNIKTVTPDTDDDGVTTVEYDCELIKDSTWGKALEITTVSNLAAVV
ncbi:MAG TPA: hypothetical protein VIM25_06285 [Candidatus Limnocylindrales bacterium]